MPAHDGEVMQGKAGGAYQLCEQIIGAAEPGNADHQRAARLQKIDVVADDTLDVGEMLDETEAYYDVE